MNLWTWNGLKETFKTASRGSTPFKAQIVTYTDVVGYGMYIEIKSNKNLDDYIGHMVHNTPTHKGTTPADLEGFFWCLQLFKLSDENDKSYSYALSDLTFGKSEKFKIYERPRPNKAKVSYGIGALMNANADTLSLYTDGETPTQNVNYLNNMKDSETNIFYTGDNNDGVSREDFVEFLKSSFERHSPKLQTRPSFEKNGDGALRWYINPIPDFKKVQSYDYMLDEYEVEEIVDQTAVMPYVAVREWAYWKYIDPSNPNNVTEDKSKVSMSTTYIDESGNYNSLYIRETVPGNIYGFPLFFGDTSSGTIDAVGGVPKIGSVKITQLPKENPEFTDYSGAISKWATFSKQKSYKIYRALDINQVVFYKGKSYVVSEVDYINEVSVIGGTTGII